MKSRALIRTAKILASILALLVAGFGAIALYFTVFIYPKITAEHRAQAQQAAAVAKLTGPDRRLAIYDAASRAIEAHFYDQDFIKTRWPALRAQYRLKAAQAPDDLHLYLDVFDHLRQAMPLSHINFTIPTPASPAAPAQRDATPTGSEIKAPPMHDCPLNMGGMTYSGLNRPHGSLIIAEVQPSSPAALAGVMPGWPVASITISLKNGPTKKTVALAPLSSSQTRIVGLTGTLPTPVQIPTQTISFTSPCAPDPAGFATRRLDSGALYIRFDHFDTADTEKVAQALRTADEHGVILDLRDNAGGLPPLLLSHLLPRHAELYGQQTTAGNTPIRADFWSHRYTGKLAILIGPGSRSAAEIAPWVLRHANRAILIGRPTGGVVMGAGFYPLPDGGTAELPILQIALPGGVNLEKTGVIPDIEIYPTSEQLKSGHDPALEAAITALKNQPS